jgi:hypothetical protein
MIVGFWIGVAVTWGGMYLYQHPEARKALLDKARALFKKKDAP